jgi:hypothetical protein
MVGISGHSLWMLVELRRAGYLTVIGMLSNTPCRKMTVAYYFERNSIGFGGVRAE